MSSTHAHSRSVLDHSNIWAEVGSFYWCPCCVGLFQPHVTALNQAISLTVLGYASDVDQYPCFGSPVRRIRLEAILADLLHRCGAVALSLKQHVELQRKVSARSSACWGVHAFFLRLPCAWLLLRVLSFPIGYWCLIPARPSGCADPKVLREATN